ncbi:hypothetical protein [Actinocorallia aurantiaca]
MRGDGTNSAVPGGDIFADERGGGLTVRVQDGVRGANGLQELTISQMMKLFYGWSDEKIRSLAGQLAKAGFEGIDQTSTRDTIWEGFRVVLMEAAKRYAADPSKAPTVEQLLRHYMKNPVGDAGEAKPKSYTEGSDRLTNPTEARAVLDRVLAEELGRDPTAAEKAAFLAALNTAEKSDPTKTTYKLDEKTGRYLNSSTSGGIDAEQFAKEWVDDDETRSKERGDYQMATTYFDALLSAIQSPVQ